MKLLLDTHILLWALTEDSRLSKKAKIFILDESNTIYYSTVSVWEIAIKHSSHPDNVTMTGRELAQWCEEAGYHPLEMRNKHVFSLETLKRQDGAPEHHDPFDRMLIAQAKEENMSFLTHDALLPYYNEKCIVSV